MKYNISMDNIPVVSGFNNRLSAKLIIIGLALSTLILVAAIIFLILRPNSTPDPSIAVNENQGKISGSLDVNGVIPVGSSITLTQKIAGSLEEGVRFVSGLTPSDGDKWSFDEGESGKSYEIQAQLIYKGKIIAHSDPITITAPAGGETLTLNVESQAETGDAVISGNIVINGYIPPGATVSVMGRKLGESEFSSIAQNLPGQARQFMSYTTAVRGVTYEVIATLYTQSSSVLGTSETLLVTAPAVNESLTINSQAISPATPTPLPTSAQVQGSAPSSTPTPTPSSSIISGSIDFNGVAPSNSRIVVFQKILNASGYNVAVDNITPVDGSTWQWGGAINSTWYELIAVLKQRQSDGSDKDISTATTVSVAAPASNVLFTLNSGIVLSAPGGPITLSCGTLSASTWGTQITFGAVSGARSFWYQVGTTSGGTEVTNETKNVSEGASLSINLNLNNALNYYARYAYGNVSNLSAGSFQFSPFSSVQQLRCGN